MWLAAFRLFSSYLAIYNCCVSTATANSIQAWPCGQALSVIWTAYAVLCVPQLLCVHSDCIIVFQASLAAKRSLYSLNGLPPALRGVQRLSNCISAWPYGQAHAFLSFGPLTARVARRVSVPQLLAITMLSLCGWPHLHDCLQITLRSSMAVCPHSDCIIAFQLGLAAKRSLYHLGRLPPALRGVQRLSHFAFQPGLPAKLMFSILRPAHHPRCAERQHASSIAIEMLSAVGRIFTIAFRLLCDPAMAVCPHSDCIIAF